MTDKKIRLALLGCGRVAQHYRKILESGAVNGWKVVGVCDLFESAAQDMARSFECPAFTDYAEMLSESKPDLVLILTPSGHHFENARTALQAGIHTLVEKPVAMLPSEAAALQGLAEEKNLLCGVAFQNRFNPAIACLRRALDAGRFGKIITAAVRLRWCRTQDYYEDGWHGTWAQDGGVINQQAIHHVDALDSLIGPTEAVCSAAANRMNKLEAEDTLTAVVRFENGALGTIEATTAARPRDFEASLSVVGEKGMAQIGGIALNKIDTWDFVAPEEGDRDIPARFSQEVPNGYGLSHGPLLQGVIDALISGSTTPPVSAAQGARTTALVHALYRSQETQGWVRLKDAPVSERLGRK